MNRFKGVLKGKPLLEEERLFCSKTVPINDEIKNDIPKTIEYSSSLPSSQSSQLVSVKVDECEMLMNYDSCTNKIHDIMLESETSAKRRSDIQTIHKEVAEIKDMFAMIHEMVDEQGESIDTIENNVVSAKHHIEEAEIELDTTEKRKGIGDKIKYGGLGLVCFVVSVPLGMYAGAGVAAYTVIAGTGLGGYALLKK
jgi:hypothetical protein